MLGSVLLVVAVLLALGALFMFIDQQEDIGSGSYTALDALWFTLLNLPQQVFELLPITALIGALLGLGTLARGSELTVMRATGISIAHLAGMCLLAGLVLIGVAVVLGEFLAPPLQQTAREQKAFSRFNNVSFGGAAAPGCATAISSCTSPGSPGTPVRRHADLRAVPAARPGGARARAARHRRRQGPVAAGELRRVALRGRYGEQERPGPARAEVQRHAPASSGWPSRIPTSSPTGRCGASSATTAPTRWPTASTCSPSGRASRAPWRWPSRCCSRSRSCSGRCAPPVPARAC